MPYIEYYGRHGYAKTEENHRLAVIFTSSLTEAK